MDRLFSLIDGKENKKYFIKDIKGNLKTKRRLLDLGFINCNVQILKKSNLRGVYLLELRNFVLALKKKETATIFVEVQKK